MQHVFPMGHERNRRMLLAIGTAGAQRVSQLAATIITIPFILHALGPAEFGIWGAATSLAFLGSMLDLGLGAALITLVAQGMAAQNMAAARGQVSASLLGTAVMAAAVLLLGGGFICHTAHGQERDAFLIACASVALLIPLSLANSVWMGLQKGAVASCWDIAQTGFNFTGLMLGVYAGAAPVVMVGLFFGSYLLAAALSWAHLLRAHPEIRPQTLVLPAGIWRPLLRKGGLFAAIAIATGLGYALDNVLALWLLGPLAAARMAIIMRIGINGIGIIIALTQPLWPAFADADGRHDRSWAKRALLWGTTGVAALCVLGGGILVVFGEMFLHWWLRGGLRLGTGLLWATALWMFALSLPRVAGLWLNATSVLKFQFFTAAATAALALILKCLASAKFGLAGIWLAAPVSWILIIWPAYAWRMRTLWRVEATP